MHRSPISSGSATKDHDLRISHVGIDRKHTRAEDSNTWFPLPELRRAAQRGRIGALAPRFHGLPTNRSHRVTLKIDCPEVVARCREDGVDAALLLLSSERRGKQLDLVVSVEPELAGGTGSAVKKVLLANVQSVELSYFGKGRSDRAAAWRQGWAEVLVRFLKGELRLTDTEILDLDEKRYRTGEWIVRLHQTVLTPFEPIFTQLAKQLIIETSDAKTKAEIPSYLAEIMGATTRRCS